MDIECATTDVMEISYESDLFIEESANSNEINYVHLKSEYKMEFPTYISTTVSTGNKSSSDLENPIFNDINKEKLSSENTVLIDHIRDIQTPPVTPILKLEQESMETDDQESMETDDQTLLTRNTSDVPTASTSTASLCQLNQSSSPPSPLIYNRDLTITTADLLNFSSDDGSDEEWASLKYMNRKYSKNTNIITSPSSSYTSTTASIEKKSSFDPKEPLLKSWSIENLALFGYGYDDQLQRGTQVDHVELETVKVEDHVNRLKALEKELEFIKETEWMFQPIESSIRSSAVPLSY